MKASHEGATYRWQSTTENNHLKAYASYLVAQFLSDPISVSEQTLSMDALIEPLSLREIEVLNLIAMGKTNKEISQELFVSPGTVKAHTSNILANWMSPTAPRPWHAPGSLISFRNPPQ